MRPGECTFVDIGKPDGEAVTVRAFTTLTPGLVVHESIGDPGWIVTHERSGLLIGFVDDPEQAQALAANLAAAGDWTRRGTDISADPVMRKKAGAIRARFNGADFVHEVTADTAVRLSR